MKRRGFSLIELIVTVAVITILSGITLSIFSFHKDFWTLKQSSFNFAKNLNNARKFSFQGIRFLDKKVCGAGLIFNKAAKNYILVAFPLDTKDCSSVKPSNFNITNIDNPENSSSVVKLTKFFSLTTSQKDIVKENLERVSISMFCEGNGCPLPNSINFQKVEIVFRNPYGEPLVFYQDAAGSYQIENWNNIKFVLQFKNDTPKEIILMQTGQILLK